MSDKKSIKIKKKIIISSLTMNKNHYKFEKRLIETILNKFKDYKVYLFVSQKLILKQKKISEIEFNNYRRSFLHKIYTFYFGLKKITKKIDPDIIISCDSITPNVVTKKLFTYYHTPSPFFYSSLYDLLNNLIFKAQGRIYSFFFNINLKKNTSIIVQSNWMKKEFSKRFQKNKIIVANLEYIHNTRKQKTKNKKYQNFLYPSFPYIYKNFELLGETAKILEENKSWDGKIIFTFNVKQNSYAKHIYKKYNHLSSLKFIGFQTNKKLLNLYKNSDALIFPSMMETWGLPLSEAKKNNLPIIAADLQYAHETIGTYHSSSFFDPKDHVKLSKLLLKANSGENIFKKTIFQNPKKNYAQTNEKLINLLINSK